MLRCPKKFSATMIKAFPPSELPIYNAKPVSAYEILDKTRQTLAADIQLERS
jgi:hypothetical protein